MEDVAGYRVLRGAASGARSRLLLGFDDGRTVVLKVCSAGDPRVPVEVEALDRAAGEHVVALLDFAADESGAVLVLERLPGGSLAELLDRRPGLEAGEAVTILAPLAVTLERMHAAGLAHGSLSLGAVLFSEDGAPTLTGFGMAELFDPGAPEVVRETIAGVVADRTAFRGLVALVLGSVRGERAEAARRLAAGMAEATPAQLAEALFVIAAPAAVGLDRSGDPEPTEWVGQSEWVAPSEWVGPSEWAGPSERMGQMVEAVVGDDPRAKTMPLWIAALLPDGVRERVERYGELWRAVWEQWPRGRRRLVLGFAAAVLTVMVAFALLPASKPAVEAEPAGASSGPAGAARPDVPLSDDVLPDDVLPDDPVEAARLLLARRADCLRNLSVICLDDVVQAGSAAQADDVALVRAVLAGGEFPSGGALDGEPVLVERLGDSALIDIRAPDATASVLLLRTAEGWRLRQYLNNQYSETPAFGADAG